MIVITYKIELHPRLVYSDMRVRFKTQEEADNWLAKCPNITITSITEEN